MELTLILSSVIQSLAISLGIGCSTFGLIYFLKESDKKATTNPVRRIVDTLLRISIGLLVVSTSLIGLILFSNFGSEYLTPYNQIIWTYLVVLFANLVFYYIDFIPYFVASGIRVVTWYALAITVALPSSITVETPYTLLLVWYLALLGAVILGISLFLSRKKLA